WGVLRASGALLVHALRVRPQEVLATEFSAVLVRAPALAALRLMGVRVILTAHNAPDPDPFYRQVWRWGVAPFIDVVVANSRFTRGEILRHGFRPERVPMI